MRRAACACAGGIAIQLVSIPFGNRTRPFNCERPDSAKRSATFAEVGIAPWFSWRRAITAYVIISAVFLLASSFARTSFAYGFALFGPIAWLLWGVPLYLMATVAFALSVLGAVVLRGRSSTPGSGGYWLLPAVVWLALGAWALLVNV